MQDHRPLDDRRGPSWTTDRIRERSGQDEPDGRERGDEATG
ncbi:hypothetical protein [Halosimplex litoreum]|nr:hypothetical protein [Halosimplex litoreum]